MFIKKYISYIIAPLAPVLLWLILDYSWVTSFPASFLYIFYLTCISYLLSIPLCLVVKLIYTRYKLSLIPFLLLHSLGGGLYCVAFKRIEGSSLDFSSFLIFTSFGFVLGFAFIIIDALLGCMTQK